MGLFDNLAKNVNGRDLANAMFAELEHEIQSMLEEQAEHTRAEILNEMSDEGYDGREYDVVENLKLSTVIL